MKREHRCVFKDDATTARSSRESVRIVSPSSELELPEFRISGRSNATSDLAILSPFDAETIDTTPPPNPSENFPPLPSADLKIPDLDEIYKVLSAYKISITHAVAPFLVRYFKSKITTITNFRRSTFKGLIERPDTEWPLLQWEEPDFDCEVFVIFKVTDCGQSTSAVQHFGFGAPQPDGRRWSRSVISWWVLGMEDFKDLIIDALQVLDVLKWSDINMINHFFDPTHTNGSPEEIARYAEKLFPSLSRLAEFEKTFEHTSFWIERLSTHSVIPGEDGTSNHSLYYATVQL